MEWIWCILQWSMKIPLLDLDLLLQFWTVDPMLLISLLDPDLPFQVNLLNLLLYVQLPDPDPLIQRNLSALPFRPGPTATIGPVASGEPIGPSTMSLNGRPTFQTQTQCYYWICCCTFNFDQSDWVDNIMDQLVRLRWDSIIDQLVRLRRENIMDQLVRLKWDNIMVWWVWLRWGNNIDWPVQLRWGNIIDQLVKLRWDNIMDQLVRLKWGNIMDWPIRLRWENIMDQLIRIIWNNMVDKSVELRWDPCAAFPDRPSVSTLNIKWTKSQSTQIFSNHWKLNENFIPLVDLGQYPFWGLGTNTYEHPQVLHYFHSNLSFTTVTAITWHYHSFHQTKFLPCLMLMYFPLSIDYIWVDAQTCSPFDYHILWVVTSIIHTASQLPPQL